MSREKIQPTVSEAIRDLRIALEDKFMKQQLFGNPRLHDLVMRMDKDAETLKEMDIYHAP